MKELVDHKKLTDVHLLTKAASLEHHLSTVTVLDAPDGPAWLKGDELVLTSGYIFKGTEELFIFVEKLIEAGASGMAIKLGRFLQEIPQEIIDLANHHDFALMLIPLPLVWTDIISTYYELKMADRVSGSGILPSDFYPLYAASKWGSVQFCQKLAELVTCEILVFDQNNTIYYENELAQIHNCRALLQRVLVSRFKKAHIENIDGTYVLLKKGFEQGLNSQQFILVRTESERLASDILEMLLMIQRLVASDTLNTQAEEKYTYLLDKLCDGTLLEEELVQFTHMNDYGEDALTGLALIESDALEQVFQELLRLSQQRFSEKEVVFYRHQVEPDVSDLVLIDIRTPLVNQTLVSLRAVLVQLQHSLSPQTTTVICLSQFYPSLAEIRKSYMEVERVRAIQQAVYPEPGFLAYDEVAHLDYLTRHPQIVTNFYEIELLLAENSSPSFDILKTLEYFLEEQNYKKAAKKMYLHENTLRYRIQKIEELLQCDLSDKRVSTHLLFKLKLWQLQKKPEN